MNRKALRYAAAALTLSILTGCGSGGQFHKDYDENPAVWVVEETQEKERDSTKESEKAAESCRDLYERAAKENALGSLETVRAIAERLGEQGYAAVDAENGNQIDMVHPELVEAFCGKVEEGEDAEVTICSVTENGGFIRFDLKTSEGEVRVTRSVLVWENGMPKVVYRKSFPAARWEYTKEGWLFFDEYQPEGYDGAPGYTALRVKPLDARCRELNRRYVLPVGYGANNLFITEWKEPDFEKLDFNDLFPLLYPLVYARPIPYEQTYEGKTYHVSETEFEGVLRTFFAIDSASLRERINWRAGNGYEYRTRSFYDAASGPNTPFPEVVDYEENADGTVTLTVHAVWPVRHMAAAVSHEVVVRPSEDGGFLYVSNHILPSPDSAEPVWYTERLTREEWERFYEDTG